MPQTTAAPSLRKVIEIYRAQHNEELDEHADKLLKRLADSPKAAKAFKRLQPKDDYDEAAIVRERQSAGARAFLNRMKKGNPQAASAIEQQLKLEDRGKAHEGEVKSLLEVILGTEVSSDQVRDAQPERLKGGHWQWAARSLPEEMRRPPKEKRKPEMGS